MRRALFAPILAMTLVVAVIGGGCGNSDDESDGLSVVATTAIVGDFAKRVAGPDATVEVLMPPGVDVHSYDPPTDAARRIARADVLLVNGFNLEGNLLKVVVENRGERSRVVAAAGGIEPIALSGDDEEHEDDNVQGQDDERVDPATFAEGDPHFWLAVPNAIRYVETIRDALVVADPAHAEGYRERAAIVIGELRVLDTEVRRRIAEVPPERRKLVVFHDAFGYFAREYGLELTATVLGHEAGSEPSAGDIASVVRTVRRQQVPAVYKEPQFSSHAVDQIASESGARVLTLYSDAYAEGVRTYEELMRANADAIVRGLR